MEERLKSCPFCENQPVPIPPTSLVQCIHCQISMTKEDWNIRPSAKAILEDDIYSVLCLEAGNKERGDLLSSKDKEIELRRYAKAICVKFGSPQKESGDLEKVLEEFDKFMVEEYGKWKIGRVEVKSFILAHWPKPDPRFVEERSSND